MDRLVIHSGYVVTLNENRDIYQNGAICAGLTLKEMGLQKTSLRMGF